MGACFTGWLSLVVIDWVTNNSRIKSDAAIGLTLSVFFGLGILLLTSIQQSGNASQSGLDKFLFGKAASMIGSDVWVFGTLSVVLIAVVIAFFKEFSLLSFDPDFAQVLGLPVRWLEIALATITVLAVAVGIQAVGVVLMASMLIAPAAAARYWTDDLRVMLLLSALFGALSGVTGAYISYLAPAMPTGPWVVVALSMIAFVSLFIAPRRGLWARYRLARSNKRKMLEENILKLFFQLGENKHNQKEQLSQHFFTKRSIIDLQNKRYFKEEVLQKGLKRLVAKDLLIKYKDKTWQLTEAGKKEGQRLVRIHRLWEVYLTKYLRIAPDHVHDDAEAIEHIITPELEKTLQQLLDYPDKDPHNSAIPYGS